jgi:RNA polymerase primary sigma factor
MTTAIARPSLTDDQRALAAANLGIARWVAHRFARTAPAKLDDFTDAATDGLLHAAARFDPERNNRFTTVAVRYARNAVLARIAYEGRHIRTPPGGLRPIDEATVPGREPAAPDVEVDDAGPGPSLDEMTRGLDDRSRAVLRMRFAEGRTLAEVGRVYGVSKERIRQVERKAVEVLRARVHTRGGG